MPKKEITNDDNTDLLILLKQLPIPRSPGLKTLIEIIEDGDSLEDFPFNLEVLVSTLIFIHRNIDFLKSIKDKGISDSILPPKGVSVFQVPKELLRDIISCLKRLSMNGLESKKVLALLPYWPYALIVFEMMRKRAEENARGWNKTRWANALRYLKAGDCPLGKHTKRVAIAQYRMALGFADEFKDLPGLLLRWQRRLGLPRNSKSGWADIVKSLVDYLSPFFPITVQRNHAVKYRYTRHEKRSSHPAVSKTTYQAAAKILHLAYPKYWPTPNAKRVSNFYHSF